MKEYKRLTKKNIKYVDGEITCPEIVRLQELEDKIENGTLIELPCKVGDTVYFIVQYIKPFIEECVVDGIEIGRENYLRCYYKHKKGFAYFRFEQILLTKAEAEAKLKELKNGQIQYKEKKASFGICIKTVILYVTKAKTNKKFNQDMTDG